MAPETPARDERALSGNHPLNAVTVANLSPRFNEEMGLNPLLTGVVVTDVSQGSYAYRSRLRRGFRIVSVNGVKVSTAADLQREIQNPFPAGRLTLIGATGSSAGEWDDEAHKAAIVGPGIVLAGIVLVTCGLLVVMQILLFVLRKFGLFRPRIFSVIAFFGPISFGALWVALIAAQYILPAI